MLVRLIQTAKGRKMDKSSLIKAEKNPFFDVLPSPEWVILLTKVSGHLC